MIKIVPAHHNWWGQCYLCCNCRLCTRISFPVSISIIFIFKHAELEGSGLHDLMKIIGNISTS